MAIRTDGIETRERLLTHARDVFVRYGYQKTTVVQISKVAQTNVASIHYHFGSKEALYAAVWKQAFQEANQRYPVVDPALPADATAEKRFESFVRSRLHLFLDVGPANSAGKLLLQNLADPVEGIELIRSEMLGPLRNHLHALIKELIAVEIDEERLLFCEMSVVHQFIAFGLRVRKQGQGACPHAFTQERIERFADHTVRFCLAAFAEIRRELQP